MLDEKFLTEQKAKLTEELKRLEEDLKLIAEPTQKGYEPKYENLGDDMEDNAFELSIYQHNVSIEKDLETVRQKIIGALKRIEDGTYGRCAEGDEIEPERLHVIPWAETCIKHSK